MYNILQNLFQPATRIEKTRENSLDDIRIAVEKVPILIYFTLVHLSLLHLYSIFLLESIYHDMTCDKQDCLYNMQGQKLDDEWLYS